ncbi:MAG: Holliday junction branch migration protein RuvA [Epsilonproteobacteria bacterium]|nr:Holliday junction branch migration protein RuvA [Campylobacterota bacterium]
MIVGLNGKVEYKEPGVVHLNVNGVIYEVFISLQTFSVLGEEVKLYTTHIVREDAQLLYGFATKTEKALFERLIKINGVGPKVALAICSTYTPSQFAQVINSNDMAGIKRVPGIGPKSAGRILVELNGFDEVLLDKQADASPKTKSYAEATEALEALGFKKDKISKALNECQSDDTASLVKEALKYLKTL